VSAPDLAELRRLLDKARTSGEWSFDTDDYGDGVNGMITDDTGRDVADGVHRREGALIVAAVNALPYLLAKVEAAERLAEAAEEMVLQAYDDYDKCKVCQGESGGGVGHESNCAVVWLGKEAGAYRKAGAP